MMYHTLRSAQDLSGGMACIIDAQDDILCKPSYYVALLAELCSMLHDHRTKIQPWLAHFPI
jgi:hypothetical protein